ncbi:unnamed protein product [Kuraishia capsulata CBS 1993]|uniref:Uncharacterized protein n=1 Tax=Kuraishia capsulata CBS 1993 TaxID=1382522 RepID=W6MPV2_9ASCO|nr:uncharacterized protein KUCA_T00004733001 [Kuraishia capsulata CBS 1993]CDK28749.1 unnamed protein product [Kuraishia capsulata CBS 1993]
MKLYQSICMIPCIVGTLFLADKVLQRRFSPLISTGIVTACVYIGGLYWFFAKLLEKQKELTGKQRANFKLHQIFFRVVCFTSLMLICFTKLFFRVENEKFVHRIQGPWKLPLQFVVNILFSGVIFKYQLCELHRQ